MQYHLLLVKMAVTKRSTNNKCWRGCREKGTLLHYWWEYKSVQPLWKTVWRFIKKKKQKQANKQTKIELPYDPVIPLLGINQVKILIRNDICTPVFSAELFTTAKT